MWYSEREGRILNVNNPYIHTHTSEHPACTRLSFDKVGCGVYQCVLLWGEDMKTLVVLGAKVSLVIRLRGALAVVVCFEAVSSKILICRLFQQRIALLDGLLLCGVHEVVWLDVAMRASFLDRSCLCVCTCAQHLSNPRACALVFCVDSGARTHACVSMRACAELPLPAPQRWSLIVLCFWECVFGLVHSNWTAKE